ncbi:hypothetical protein HanXRQr2_Chr13g0608581 [Helianthus annuus]|uniref:Uncharacterized protein n=1 Tax=Helianthus annuus TaxID=4232 RepID=A0A9K3EK76_HELAN|nr:hypothetical protein HanXRQr2_Chr13g0608581 [Helianthus annuus]
MYKSYPIKTQSLTRYVQHALMFPRVIETPAAVFRSTSTSDENSSRSRPGLPNSLHPATFQLNSTDFFR